ncbi:hypothetical protein [uncultured Kordia sp.]|uniref:hypothetical protein n=1 Tax=uncultured Kordia sp. TaxID=507699 RepID=UPI00261D42F4|nr:hypothetical protein [uncultured Kordia sp.]
MSLPTLGTYAPTNQTMSIEITGADAGTGTIEGTYEHKYTPEGTMSVNGKIGGYAWVNNNDGGNASAPFSINFTVSERPDGFPYCLVDFWNGFYTKSNSIVITGVRSYVKDDGTTQSIGLGTLELYLNT